MSENNTCKSDNSEQPQAGADGWGEQLQYWLKRGSYRDYANLRIVIEQYKKVPFKSMLDAGCGIGILLDYFQNLSVFTIGVDCSPAIMQFHGKQTHLQVIGGDVSGLPFNSGLFEMVICLGLVEHFKNSVPVLEELRRVTRPGGYAMISVPSLYSIFPALAPFWYFTGGRYRYGWRQMIGRMYSKKSFHSLLKKAGWQAIEIFPFKVGSLLDWMHVPFSEKTASWVETSKFPRNILGIMLCAICYFPKE